MLLILIGFFVGFAFGGFLFSKSIESVSQKHVDTVKHITRSYDERARRSREANKSVLNYVTGGALGVGTSEDVDDSVEEALGVDEDFSVEESTEGVGDEVVDGFDNDAVEGSVEESSDSGEDVFADEEGSVLVKDSGEEFDTDSSEFEPLTARDVATEEFSELSHEDALDGVREETGDECDTVNSASYMEDNDEDVPEENVSDTFVEEDAFDAPVSHAIDLDDLNSEDEEALGVGREEDFEISPEKLDSSTEVEKDVPVRGDDASGSTILTSFGESDGESEKFKYGEGPVDVGEDMNLIDETDDEFESLSNAFDFEENEPVGSVVPVEDSEIIDEGNTSDPAVADEGENTEDSLIGSIDVESLMRAEIARKFPVSETRSN